MFRKSLIAGSVVVALFSSAVAFADAPASPAAQVSAKQVALIMKLNRAHTQMDRKDAGQIAPLGLLGLALVAGVGAAAAAGALDGSP
jgi:ABC-type transporter MlaC component